MSRSVDPTLGGKHSTAPPPTPPQSPEKPPPQPPPKPPQPQSPGKPIKHPPEEEEQEFEMHGRGVGESTPEVPPQVSPPGLLAGTVTASLGDPNLVGSDTEFTKHVRPGQRITLANDPMDDYRVLAVPNDTHLMLDRPITVPASGPRQQMWVR